MSAQLLSPVELGVTPTFEIPTVPVRWNTSFLAMTPLPPPFPPYLMPVQPTATELYRRTPSEVELRSAKRVRASRPKVKSGCITCKTRRVKCDETKPHCLRCQKFGRTCDGYPDRPSGKGVAIVPIQPRIPSVTIYNPGVSIHSTEDENQYFQSFINHSAKELSGFFDPSFWTRLVLQEAHLVPPIRHAAIAIGALNKSLESAPRPNLKVNVIQSIDKKHHEAAVVQYMKAIQALNSYISASNSPQLRTALVACLLFVCFETFQGSFASSVQQTYGGLKILRSYYQGKPGSRPWIPPRSPSGASSKVAMTGKISKELQTRQGCDNISKIRAMSMHVEEYLDEDLQPDTEGNIGSISDAFIYNPSMEHHDHSPGMTGTTFSKERQRTIMSLPARKRSIYSAGISSGLVSDMMASKDESDFLHRKSSVISTPDSVRKSSATSSSISNTDLSFSSASRKASTFSNSSVSTPVTYTPPSTGPHTPSSSYGPHSQPSSTTQAPTQDLSNTRKYRLASRSPTPPPLHNDFAIEEILIQTFVRLDGQGLFFGMVPGIPPLIWDIHKTWHLPIPTSFPSFASAHRCWDFLMDRALQFYRRTWFNRVYAPSNLDSPEQIAAELTSYLNQLDAFAAAFQPILDQAVGHDGSIANPPALLLSIYQKITIITLASVPSDSEMVYDTYLADFKYVVRTCAMLIASRDTTQRPPNPRFTFEVGIVPPLHVVITKCRDPVVRREATNLLFASPRQEGMWDGVLTARIGKWMVSCEEEGLKSPLFNGSRYPSVSEASSPGARGGGGPFSYPSPPPAENRGFSGGFEDGKSISEVVNQAVGKSALNEIDGNNAVSSAGSSPRNGNSEGRRKQSVQKSREKTKEKAKGKEVPRAGWMVPEEYRVRLMTVDFHIPDRYIKVKCQKALPDEDGKREERETVIAW